MTTSSLFFDARQDIIQSPRTNLWFRLFTGNNVGMGPESNGARGFTFKPGDGFGAEETNALNVGDRITIQRRAGQDKYGITNGTNSFYRGTIQNVYVTPGTPSALTVFLTIDADSDPLPNTIFDQLEANSVDNWFIIKNQGNVAPESGRWYLFNRQDSIGNFRRLLNGRLWDGVSLNDLALIRTHDAPTAETDLNLGIARILNVGIGEGELSVERLDGGIFGVAATNTSQSSKLYGAGSENAIASFSGSGNIKTVTPIASWLPLLGNKTNVEVIQFTNGSPAAFLFFLDEVEFETTYATGWNPPLWRNFKHQNLVSEGGTLLSRHTILQPTNIKIPITNKSESEMTGAMADLVRRAQANNFMFLYRKALTVADSSPVMYGWLNSIMQTRYDAPTYLSGGLDCDGYFRYS